MFLRNALTQHRKFAEPLLFQTKRVCTVQKNYGSLLFSLLVTLYAIFQIEFFDLYHWKEKLTAFLLSGSTSLGVQDGSFMWFNSPEAILTARTRWFARFWFSV